MFWIIERPNGGIHLAVWGFIQVVGCRESGSESAECRRCSLAALLLMVKVCSRYQFVKPMLQ